MGNVLDLVANTSYVSRDFQKIFPELLDLVKHMTTKWDPSISTEADPGVILLKLNALLGDKLNYAIDKNTLECFPLSVTQNRNARQMYLQLGYKMSWYNAATTTVALSWKGDTAQGSCTIPAFTMVSNDDGSIVYTLLGPVSDSFVIRDLALTFDHLETIFSAIQGISLDYQINGETTITAANLDSNNRLYFDTVDVAENGIFITNVDEGNYTEWQQKDNLLVEALNNKFYTFGVAQDTSACYLEFPVDAENIFKNGIEIKYIKTSGLAGNVPANAVSKFISDVSRTSTTGETIVLTADNVRIANYSSATNGVNPESIDSAYKNYKHVVGTFDTLVTLRDYINYILLNDLVSNGFVTDRSTDPQCCYNIISNVDGISQSKAICDFGLKSQATYDSQGNVGSDGYVRDSLLTAFDIKLYLFNYITDFSSYDSYNKSFGIISYSALETIKAFIKNQKSISHDYADLIPTTQNRANICFLKNMYPVSVRITTAYPLDKTPAAELQQKIIQALYSNLNSQLVEFSEQVSQDTIRSIILNCDEIISSVTVDNPEFTTYAVVQDGEKQAASYREIPVSESILEKDKLDITVKFNNTFYYNPEKTGYIPWAGSGTVADSFCIYDYLGVPTRFKCIEATSVLGEPFTLSKWQQVPVVIPTTRNDSYETFYRKFTDALGFANHEAYRVVTFKYSGSGAYSESNWYPEGINTTAAALGFSTTSEDAATVQLINGVVVHVSKAEQCRDEIYSKSVVCGATPLFINDEEVDYKFNQSMHLPSGVNSHYSSIDKIITETEITIDNTSPGTTFKQYELRSNESIQLFSPNYINSVSYSNMAKYEYLINEDVAANATYELRQGEYLALYWKVEGDASEYYSYHVYSKGCVFSPSFAMTKHQTRDLACLNLTYGLDPDTNMRNTGTSLHPVYEMDNVNDGSMSSGLNDEISSGAFSVSNHVLSGSKKITMQKLNLITLDKSNLCYWITNLVSDSGENYILRFDENNKKTLDSGEYFIQSNQALTSFVIFGSGTTLQRYGQDYTGNSLQDDWLCTKLDSNDILENGSDFLSSNSAWRSIPKSVTLDVVENRYTTLGAGSTIGVSPKATDYQSWEITFNRLGYEASAVDTQSVLLELTLADFNIQYKFAGDVNPTTLDSINSMSTSGWGARSLLGIDMSPETDLILYDGQTITLSFSDQENTVEIEGSAKTYSYIENSAITWDGDTTGKTAFRTNYYLVNTTSTISDIKQLYDASQTLNKSFTTSINGTATTITLSSTNTTVDGVFIYCKDGSSNTRVIIVTQDTIESGTAVNKGIYLFKNVAGGITEYISNFTFGDFNSSRDYYPVALLSNENLSFDGGGDYQPAYLDENLDIVYPSLYVFSKNISPSNNLVRYLTDGAVVLTYGQQDEQYITSNTFEVYVPTGEYIIEMSNSGAQIYTSGNVTVTVDKGTANQVVLGTMYNAQQTNLRTISNTFLYWNNTVNSNHSFTIDTPQSKDAVLIILENPFKFSKSSSLTSYEFEKFRTLVKELDVDNQFDYTFQVSSDDAIYDPLEASSFFNVNHPYYKYTISEASKILSENLHILGIK